MLTEFVTNILALEGGPRTLSFNIFSKVVKMEHSRNNPRDDAETSNANQDLERENSPLLEAN